MSARISIPQAELVEITSPYVEPRVKFQTLEPRKVNNLTLIEGKTFLSTTVAGDITPAGAPDVGFFHDDTRFLSYLELKVGGQRAVVLSSSTESTFVSQIELTTGNITLRDSFDLPENTIHIRREQLLGSDLLFDRFTFENFNLGPVEMFIEISFEADFVDVFQVRGCPRPAHGQYYRPVVEHDHLSFYYRGLDGILRQTIIAMRPAPAHLGERSACWDLKLPPLERFQMEITVTPLVEGKQTAAHNYEFGANLRRRREKFAEWQSLSTIFSSSHGVFDAALQTGIGDFHALQIPDGNQCTIGAGIPWFATLFGRDSIIASYQALGLNPQLAIDTLRVLARYQGTEYNDWRDEEPGKILHELRTGEMTRSGEMPFGPYYGSVDATPLFLILLSETYNWTADDELMRELLPAAYRALDWIDRYGDLDGDGFQEYRTRSSHGYYNQGWKDAGDAIPMADGTLAELPIATCELQGYAYDAKLRLADLYDVLDRTEAAARLRLEAKRLYQQFNDRFWWEAEGTYYLAFDGQKRPVESVASNAGHLLASGIVPPERAARLVARLMAGDMWSGWGIRTLSSDHVAYNPFGYHTGTVWPHDNAMIAGGFRRYGFVDEATAVAKGLFDAAERFLAYRLPELFAGLPRQEGSFPVQYLGANVPQAWAASAVFRFIAVMGGIHVHTDRTSSRIYLDPALPDWLPSLSIRDLRAGRGAIDLDFEDGHVTVRSNTTHFDVVHGPPPSHRPRHAEAATSAEPLASPT